MYDYLNIENIANNMTTCVYCKKDIDEFGDYNGGYDCPKTRNKDYDIALNICERCKFWIPEGKEVPAP